MRRPSAGRTFAVFALSPVLIATVVSSSAGSGSSVALGSSAFAKPDGEGWGAARPPRIYNGGDPSGPVAEIQWTSWGANVAIGYGLGSIFKPGGGYSADRYRRAASSEPRPLRLTPGLYRASNPLAVKARSLARNLASVVGSEEHLQFWVLGGSAIRPSHL